MTFSGKYQFKTRAEKPIRIAFLYSKLTETDEAFSFTSPVRSWRRMRPLYPVNPLAKQSFYCHEMPDNCGNYASLSDCLIRKLDSKFAPQSGSDARGNNNPADSIIALFSIGDDSVNTAYTQQFNIFNLLSSGIGSTLKAGFWADYGSVNTGMRPTVPIQSAVLFTGMTISTGLTDTMVGYDVSARKWNGSAFTEGDNYYFPKTTTGINSVETLEYYAINQTGNFTLDSYGGFVAHTASEVICNSNIEAVDWYVSGAGNFSGSSSEQHIGSGRRANIGTGYVIFQGSKNQLSDFATLLGQAISRWDLDGGVTLQVVANPFGCSTTGDLNGGGLPADPDPDAIPPVTSATYMGRYSEIFVNFQGDGGVKEVKLPIRFPTRATKVQYGDAGFYNKNISPTSGQQPVVAQWTSELFKGVLELDADFIYAKILYAPFREWKEGEKPFAKPANNETSYSHNQGEWTLETRILNAPTASNEYLEATRDVVPQVDWFNKCRVFKIRQSDMTIVEDVTYSRGANQAISQEGWTHEITKDYVLLDHRTEAKYIPFIGADDYLSPPNLVVPPTTGKRGYCGTPIVYPQIGLGIDHRARYQLSPYTFPDFLTPQEFWTDLDWIIYLLSEKPANHFVDWTERLGYQDVLKNLYFETPGKYSGYGRTPRHEANDYAGTNLVYSDYTDIDSGYGFMDKIVEYNCFLGSAIRKNGLIEKWVRVSPNSFPIPYIRIVQ
jgi:hypothetical protein